MLSGNISTINSQSNTLSGFQEASISDNAELKSYVEIRNELDINGDTVKYGVAVDEYYATEQSIGVNGAIDVSETEVKRRMWTRFWIAPNDYIIVKNSSGTFAFDIIERAIDGEVEDGQFDLIGLINQYPGQWMGTFDDRPDNVNGGTLFGEDIERDPEIGNAYQTSNKNQIGIEIPYQGKTYKVRVGNQFVQTYGVNERQEWLEFVNDRMLNYLN
jgi:hypothetical protein